MENLLYRRTVTRLYDLKGSSRSRYNADSTGKNKVLLDQNLIEAMPTSPIFVGNKAKRLLERGVWNDTGFLAVSFITSSVPFFILNHIIFLFLALEGLKAFFVFSTNLRSQCPHNTCVLRLGSALGTLRGV